MRHNIYGKKLGRNKNQRQALFRSLIQSLFLSERIETTLAKAQAIKGLVDKTINKAKNPQTRREVESLLVSKKVSQRLVDDILPRVESRNSGYTSIVKIGRRLGDGAMLVQMRLLLEDAKGTKGIKVLKESKESEESKVEEIEKIEAEKPKRAKKEAK